MIAEHETQLKDKGITEALVKNLNAKYKNLTSRQRVAELYKDFDQSEVMLTSSFAATSALLLKVFSEINKSQRIYFIDTGYHFGETIKYKDKLTPRSSDHRQNQTFKHTT